MTYSIIGTIFDITRYPLIIDNIEEIQQLISSEIHWEQYFKPYCSFMNIDCMDNYNNYIINNNKINKYYFKNKLPKNIKCKINNIYINENEIGCQIILLDSNQNNIINNLNIEINNNYNNVYYISLGYISDEEQLQYFKMNTIHNINEKINEKINNRNNNLYTFTIPSLELINISNTNKILKSEYIY